MRRLAAALSLIAGLTGCSSQSPVPATLRVSAIPDQSTENVRAQHIPVMNAVCAKAGVRCEWVDIPTYQGVVEALGAGTLDLAYLGGATFVQAHERLDAIPIAIRDVDTRFSSTIVALSDSPIRRLEDLQGKSFAFGNRSSTSGHVMARYFLERAKVHPEGFFGSVENTRNHDETLARVAGGKVSAGIVNNAVGYKAMLAGGKYAGELRVIWETPPYIDYVWTVRREMPRDLRQKLLDAFLDLDRSNPADAAALAAEGAGGFLPTRAEDYAAVADALREQRP
jgi:phosphonate transport system substrate-binding protein